MALTLTVLLQRNTYLFPLLLLSLPLWHCMRPNLPFLSTAPKAWWSAVVEEAVSERRKAFASVHISDEDRQAYISASRRASSVIAKAKAETWLTTCFSY